jgi:hypothetical protein
MNEVTSVLKTFSCPYQVRIPPSPALFNFWKISKYTLASKVEGRRGRSAEQCVKNDDDIV